MPAAGYRSRDGVLMNVGTYGYYLSSSPIWRDGAQLSRIGCLAFGQGGVNPLSDAALRSEGMPVRCVQHLREAAIRPSGPASDPDPRGTLSAAGLQEESAKIHTRLLVGQLCIPVFGGASRKSAAPFIPAIASKYLLRATATATVEP